MKNTNYFFPDTEKVGGVIFHYNKRINESFVKIVKQDINTVIEKLKKYRNINLKNMVEALPLHVYIYPDIKSFRSAMGYEMQRIETRQMHFMASNNVETRYILTDEAGNVHLVLPVGRSHATYTTFSSELVSIIVGEYIEMNEKQKYEMKTTIKKYIKSERQKEEDKKKKEQVELEEKEREEQEAKEREEEEEKERLEAEEREAEEALQQELEEAEEKEREEALLALSLIEDEELEEMANAQAKVEEINDAQSVPAWLVYGWQGFMCGKLENKANLERFKELRDKLKLSKPTKLKENINSELDLDVAVAAVEYIVSVYGYKAYVKLCETPDNIKGIMYKATSMTEAEAKEKFNSEVKEYITEVLSTVKLKEALVIDKEGTVTEIGLEELEQNKVRT